jgi:hypothetical protein
MILTLPLAKSPVSNCIDGFPCEFFITLLYSLTKPADKVFPVPRSKLPVPSKLSPTWPQTSVGNPVAELVTSEVCNNLLADGPGCNCLKGSNNGILPSLLLIS